MRTLSAVAYAAKQSLRSDGIDASTGHIQQIAAAGLGHATLASYQASGEDDELPSASLLVLDVDAMLKRATQFGLDADWLHDAIVEAIQNAMPDLEIVSPDEFIGDLESSISSSAIVEDELVISQTAMTNGFGAEAEILDVITWADIENAMAPLELDGIVRVDQDPDKVFWGDEVEITVRITINRLGKRLFGPMAKPEVTRAALRWMGEPTDRTYG